MVRQNRSVIVPMMIAVVWVTSAEATAQLFGSRSFGQGISGRPGARTMSASDAGTISGTERFLRSNRQRNDFIGSDSADRQGFVGAIQGQTTGTVQSATTGLRIETGTTSSINRPRGAPSSTGIYEPRLVIAFSTAASTGRSVNSRLAKRLQESESFGSLGRISVSVAAQTATLRGVVASERDRRMAELLALFEPGISAVQNDLSLTPQKTPKPSKHRKRRASRNR